MPKLSAGILVYRQTPKLEVFLVHPGGPFWAKKDAGAWSLPKGEHGQDEDAFAAAKREFKEETGHDSPVGEYAELGMVKYGNKQVTAWAIEGMVDADHIKSNYFEMQWPPKSGQMQQFPEVDKAGWFTPGAAKTKITQGQAAFIDRLVEKLGVTPDEVPGQLALFD